MMLKKKTYKPPAGGKWKRTLIQTLPFTLIYLGLLGATVWVLAVNGFEGKGWYSMLAMDAFAGSLYAWALIHYYKEKAYVSYKVKGVSVRFMDLDYYVPPKVFGDFLQEILDQFQVVLLNDKDKKWPHFQDAQQLIDGVLLVFEPNMLIHSVYKDKKAGLTYPNDRRSRIYAPHVLDHTTAGYELKLQACHRLFPNRGEAGDLAWLKENNLM